MPDSQSDVRWSHLMDKIDAIVLTVDKIEERINEEHNKISDRLRVIELNAALLKQRVYFISAGISGGVGTVIAAVNSAF